MSRAERPAVTEARDGIAVVGMACVFPGAADLDAYWRNIQAGVDAIAEVPPERWDPLYYDPAAEAVDRFYCRRGGFVDGLLEFDALGFGVMPVAARGAEPDQLAALQVAAKALQDAGYADRALPRERTGVVLGRGNYIGAGMTRLEQHVRTAEQLVSALRELLPELDEARLQAVKAEFRARLPPYGPDTAIGLVPNLTASRIANRLDLGGPAYTLDAACASALLAVERAATDLHAGRVDLALAGGVHLSHDVAFWSVFTQLGALSRSQQIRPFDRRADGLLIGEGLGIVVLKRQRDAERDGDRIYAVLGGLGVASDGRSATIMTPSLSGQRRALEQAWRGCGLDPAALGLVEAHGTATPVGDAAEVATLRDFFGPAGDGPRAALGSVKSMIGHTMPAAGAAGLIKAVLAVHHGVLPPTLHCEEPLPELAQTRFRTLSRAEPWPAELAPGGRRVAAVNAFGFGGINAHVVVRSHGAAPARPRAREGEELLWLARGSRAELDRALREGAPSGGEGPCRLALVDPTPERRARARAALARGGARRGRDGLWIADEGLLAAGGKLAFLYPGVEAQTPPRLPDVARRLERALPPEVEGTELERRGVAVVENGRLLTAALERLGLAPDVLAGHSTGEWTGMMAAGLIPPEDLDGFLGSLSPGRLEVPGVVFLSVAAGVERVSELVADVAGVVLTHDNCPHQVVLCGAEGAIAQARQRLLDARILAHELPFRSGFHAPFLRPYLGPHLERLATMPLAPARVPLWSATTGRPYPDDLDAVRALAARHLVEPVRFRRLVEALYEDGARVFVQVGMGSLVGFVSDTLKGREHLALSAQEPQRAGLAQLRRVAAALFVEGADVDLAWLDPPRAAEAPPRPALRLDLGVPLVHLRTPLDLRVAPPPPSTAGDPLQARFAALHDEVQRSLGQVQAAWTRQRAALPPPEARTWTRSLSVPLQPFLADHSLIPQPPGWPVLADRNPVVPMTMILRMVCEAAEAVAPGRVAVEVVELVAQRWLAVEPPVELTLRTTPEGPDRVRVELVGYAQATVRLATDWPAAPPAGPAALPGEGPVPVTAAQMYAQRWMFHGPAYQSVARLDAMGEGGIRGELVATEADGALLDGAGQLLGLWVMLRAERDRLAMPIRLERVRLYGPEPTPGQRLECTCRVHQLGRHEVRADLELARGGRAWCRIEGWTDWRFDTDERLWAVMQQTEHHLLSERRAHGLVVLDDAGRSTTSRDYLARRYLDAGERAALEALRPDARHAWLCTRIAAKDAARRASWERGGGPLFPVQVALEPAGPGRLLARLPGGELLLVAVDGRGPLAAAVASPDAWPQVAVGLADDRASAVLSDAPAAHAERRGAALIQWTCP